MAINDLTVQPSEPTRLPEKEPLGKDASREAVAGGQSLLVVCDGPRPPARVLKTGLLHLARESGLPLWLVRTSWAPALVLRRSWARFVLPSPFARGVVLADGPFHVPSGGPRRPGGPAPRPGAASERAGRAGRRARRAP